jgi:hypothetical protein
MVQEEDDGGGHARSKKEASGMGRREAELLHVSLAMVEGGQQGTDKWESLTRL